MIYIIVEGIMTDDLGELVKKRRKSEARVYM